MKKLLALFLTLLTVIFAITACGTPDNDDNGEAVKIRVGYMAGPTGMGMAKLIHDNGGVAGNDKYSFTKYTDANAAATALANGSIDVICLPTNNAMMNYNKSNPNSQVLALNCLNSLYVVTDKNTTLNSLSELEGKTIYTLKNGTPALILRAILAENGINATVSTTAPNGNEILLPADIGALVTAGSVDIALMPEPIVTSSTLANKDYSVDINLANATDMTIAMGCIVGNKSFVSENKESIDAFLNEYKASIEYIVNPDNKENAATYVVETGVMGAAPAAKKALTNLGTQIAYIDGADIKNILTNMYTQVGLNTVGGKIPEDEFFYEK